MKNTMQLQLKGGSKTISQKHVYIKNTVIYIFNFLCIDIGMEGILRPEHCMEGVP